jgi:hypothetical protein
MKRRGRPTDVFNLSFLDVISCGFGAIILLLVLTLALEPRTVKRITTDLRDSIEDMDLFRETLAEESQTLERQRVDRVARLAEARAQFVAIEQELSTARNQDMATQRKALEQKRIEDKLKAIRQTLSAETKRLLDQPAYKPPDRNATIGGIPVDSEYIIFIIDTSGSMLQGAWPLVVAKVKEVLSIYPNVKGIQVVNDMGKYMFSGYAGRWIPDTPARRKEVIRRLRSWQSFSNSSPVEGIVHAVRRYFKKDRRISLYVFGDDFSHGSIDDVIREVAKINKHDAGGLPRVRIHTFGFPVLFKYPVGQANRGRFAHLMRLLAERNAGSFVGLPDVK